MDWCPINSRPVSPFEIQKVFQKTLKHLTEFKKNNQWKNYEKIIERLIENVKKCSCELETFVQDNDWKIEHDLILYTPHIRMTFCTYNGYHRIELETFICAIHEVIDE